METQEIEKKLVLYHTISASQDHAISYSPTPTKKEKLVKEWKHKK